MKLSLTVPDQHQNPNPNPKVQNNPLLLRAKVPITVFGLPFLSAVAATDISDVSLSLGTNFSSGPSLKFSYSPTSATTTTATAAAAAASPAPWLSVTLKSGVGLFGSPRDSPLILSAQFSIDPRSPNPNPTFFLQIKPQFGDFSLRKTTHSPPNPAIYDRKIISDVNSFGFVPLERPMPWKDLTMKSPYKESLLSGIAVTAKTELPVTKRLAMSFRWAFNFPDDIKKQLPFLTVNKIGFERVDRAKEMKVKTNEDNKSDLMVLKDLFLSTRRELDALQRDNREMKQRLEETKLEKPQGQRWTYTGHDDRVTRKAATPLSESFGEVEQWKSKKSSREENVGRKEGKKNANWQ